jgi:hypothetical protein
MIVMIVAGTPPVHVAHGRFEIDYLFELSSICAAAGHDWRDCRYRQIDTSERSLWEPVPAGPGAMLRRAPTVLLRPASGNLAG